MANRQDLPTCTYEYCRRKTTQKRLCHSKTIEGLLICNACKSYEDAHGRLVPRAERRRLGRGGTNHAGKTCCDECGRPSTKTRINKSGEIKQVYISSPLDPSISLCTICYRVASRAARKLKQKGIKPAPGTPGLSKKSTPFVGTDIPKPRIPPKPRISKSRKKRKASKQSIDFFKLDDTEYDPLEPDTDFNPLDTDYNKRDPDFRLSVEQVAGRKQEFQAGRHSYYAPPRRKRRKTAQELTEEMFLQKFHVMAEQDDGMDIEEKAKQMVEINKEIQALWDKFKGTERMQSLRRKDSTLDDFLEELEAINQEMYAEMNRTFWKQENEHDKEEIT